MEQQCEKTVPRLLNKPAAVQADQVYVCLGCGRRSWDKYGVSALVSGWGVSCSKAAVKLPVRALQLDYRGVVTGVSRLAILQVREAALRAAN